VRLAVLSACESGVGKNYAGEGMFSVARGFVYAGCPSLVMSLWRVNDYNTASLMGIFYENLAKNLTVDKALRNAKLEFIGTAGELGAHPANWAAFVNIGSTSLNISRSNAIYYLIVSILFVIFFTFFLIRKKVSLRIRS
jgi:CHAT domain-containing protein